MPYETRAGPSEDLPIGTVAGAGRFAIGNRDGDCFALTRRCRHLGADLARGSIDRDGCLRCPWHGAGYDVDTGRMVKGPGGIFAKIPGLGWGFKTLTKVLPLGRGKVTERDGELFITRAD